MSLFALPCLTFLALFESRIETCKLLESSDAAEFER